VRSRDADSAVDINGGLLGSRLHASELRHQAEARINSAVMCSVSMPCCKGAGGSAGTSARPHSTQLQDKCAKKGNSIAESSELHLQGTCPGSGHVEVAEGEVARHRVPGRLAQAIQCSGSSSLSSPLNAGVAASTPGKLNGTRPIHPSSPPPVRKPLFL
jgi:hypothetical protein